MENGKWQKLFRKINKTDNIAFIRAMSLRRSDVVQHAEMKRGCPVPLLRPHGGKDWQLPEEDDTGIIRGVVGRFLGNAFAKIGRNITLRFSRREKGGCRKRQIFSSC